MPTLQRQPGLLRCVGDDGQVETAGGGDRKGGEGTEGWRLGGAGLGGWDGRQQSQTVHETADRCRRVGEVCQGVRVLGHTVPCSSWGMKR